MPKLTLADVTATQNQTSLANSINTNNTAIEQAIENTLSRDGSTPNSMGADIDMDSHRVLNLPSAASNTEPVTLGQLNFLTGLADAQVIADTLTEVQDLRDETEGYKDAAAGSATTAVNAASTALSVLPPFGTSSILNGAVTLIKIAASALTQTAGNLITWATGPKYPSGDGSDITNVSAASVVSGATGVTPTSADSSTKVATTAHVHGAIVNDLNVTGSAPMFACRAWASWNGVGTVALLGGGNVSSITDLGVGLYQVNFTTPMPNANYAVSVVASSDSGARLPGIQTAPGGASDKTASMFKVQVLHTSSGATYDPYLLSIIVVG